MINLMRGFIFLYLFALAESSLIFLWGKGQTNIQTNTEINHYREKNTNQVSTAYNSKYEMAFKRAEKVFLKALVYQNQGKDEEAFGLYQESLLIDPNFTSSHINLGNLYKKKGYLNKAEWHYITATALSPGSFHAHFNLGELYLEQKKYAEAEMEFSRAGQILPEDLGVLVNLSHVYLRYYKDTNKMANLNLARKFLMKVIRKNPRYAHAYYNMGLVSEHENKFGIALSYYREAIRYYDSNAEFRIHAQKRIAHLNQVLK